LLPINKAPVFSLQYASFRTINSRHQHKSEANLTHSIPISLHEHTSVLISQTHCNILNCKPFLLFAREAFAHTLCVNWLHRGAERHSRERNQNMFFVTQHLLNALKLLTSSYVTVHSTECAQCLKNTYRNHRFSHCFSALSVIPRNSILTFFWNSKF
jgi:hypothetical protein